MVNVVGICMNNENAKKTNYLLKSNCLLLIGIILLLPGGNAFAGKVKLSWNASKSRGVEGYKIYYGLSKKQYTASIDVGKRLNYKLKGLTNGQRYYIAVTAYDKSRTVESRFSNEVRPRIPGVTVDFTPSITSGTAPLIVTFTPTTVGVVKRWKWKFSASSIPASNSKIPTVTFSKPGTYTVSLKATGSDGISATKTKQIVVTTPAPAQAQALATTQSFGTAQTKESVITPVQALAAAYGFEESGGITINDSSGHGNQGAIKQAVRVKTGRYGKGLKFDGVDDWVTVKDSDSLDLTSGFTFEAWVKPNAVRRSVVVAKQRQQGTAYDLYAYEDHDLPFSSFHDGFDYNPISGHELLPIKKWTHLAATFDGMYQHLYVNGVHVRTAQSQNGLIKQSKGVLRIGGNSVWGDFFQGYIDEVRIYNYALNAGEIQRDLRTPISSP